MPPRAPYHEQLHEASRDTGQPRCRAGGVVRTSDRETEGEGAQGQDGGCAGRVYARVVGIARARQAVEAEGDGAEGGEDTRAHSQGQTGEVKRVGAGRVRTGKEFGWES